MAKPKAEQTYDLVYFDQGTDGSGHSQSTISIAYGDGLGGFVKGPSIAMPGYFTTIDTGDFNGDGQTDVLDTAAGGLGISLSNGHGGYKFRDVLPAHTTEGIVSLLSADVDGDGDLDAVYATTDLGETGGHIFVATNDGAGKFTDPVQVTTDDPVDVFDLATFDYDKDGDQDLYAIDGDKLRLFKNDGNGAFTAFASGGVAGSLPNDIVFVDLDGDGKKEIASASGYEIVFVTTGLLAGSYKSIDLADHDWAAAIAAGDIDGDGDQDLVSANNMYFHEDTSEQGDASSVSIYTNDGKGNFAIKTIELPDSVKPDQVQLVDLDGDGDLDILASSLEQASMLINNGKGKFKVVDAPLQPDGGFVGGVVAAEINGPIEGTGKNEALKGTAAADLIDGKAGNDKIIGGAGVDQMTGGAGDDRFIFTKLSDSAAGDRFDLITDFKHNQDRLDFSAINPHTKSGKFDFIGEHKFDHHPGEIRFELFDEKGKANDHTIVEVDFDGNKKADMQIELHGLVHLDKGDFIL